jgi:signal peptidase II
MIRLLVDAMRPWRVMLLAMVATLAADQLSKWLVVELLGRDARLHRWEIAGRYLALEYVENTGAAFGLFAGRVWLLTLVAIIVAVVVVFLLRDARHDRLQSVALGLVVGGATGNIVDRFRFNHVTDFLAVGIWPKFNLADAAITVGLVLIAWSMLHEDSEIDRPRHHGV